MRDRLIELIQQAEKQQCLNAVCGDIDSLIDSPRGAGFIADHLLANGVIVPPCKVGDVVYVVSRGAGFSVVCNVYKATAKDIHLDRWGQLFICVETDKENIGGYVEIERVFLTREEAEMALKGGEG